MEIQYIALLSVKAGLFTVPHQIRQADDQIRTFLKGGLRHTNEVVTAIIPYVTPPDAMNRHKTTKPGALHRYQSCTKRVREGLDSIDWLVTFQGAAATEYLEAKLSTPIWSVPLSTRTVTVTVTVIQVSFRLLVVLLWKG
eukprot:jgi/Chrzof1/2869/Cz12g02070.t1